jgi:hypothetical protein
VVYRRNSHVRAPRRGDEAGDPKGLAGTLGVSVAGAASRHPGGGTDDHDPLADLLGQDHQSVEGVSTVGYHSLGGKGTESLGGRPEEPHYCGISEFKIHDDLAFVGILSSREPTLDRGRAILDVSNYTRAQPGAWASTVETASTGGRSSGRPRRRSSPARNRSERVSPLARLFVGSSAD